MTTIYYNLFSEYISGWKLDLLVACCVALTITFSVVIFGWAMNVLESGVIGLIARLFGMNWALFICNYLTFPGVMLHELSHAIVITLTGGKVTKIKLLEVSRTGRLGHVEFYTRGPQKLQALQMACGSCAPVVFGIIEILLLRHFITTYSFAPLWNSISYYLIFSIACHMSMSKEDLINYFHGMIYIFPSVTTVHFLWHVF